jgi:hypothetical protein
VNPVRMGRFDNWECEKRNSGSFCVIFDYLVDLAWRIHGAPDCDPNMDEIFFPAMSMHKELNSLCITLVTCFDPKHFLVETTAPRADYWLRPNRQYTKPFLTLSCS